MEALATYQQVRQHLKGTRLRRKVDAKGGGKRARPKGGRPFGQPAGKGKKGSQQTCEARRVHVQQLKLRTRCRASRTLVEGMPKKAADLVKPAGRFFDRPVQHKLLLVGRLAHMRRKGHLLHLRTGPGDL